MSEPFVWREEVEFDSEIDVREEVAEIITNRGRWGFLRKARTMHSPDWNEERQEAPENDPFNIDTGFLYDDYFVQYRRQPTIDMQTGPAREARMKYGMIAPQRYIFYLKHPCIDTFPAIVPTKNDKIIEVTVSDSTHLPTRAYNIEAIYDIQQTHDYRDKNGRIEYWSLVCQQQVLSK